MIPIAQQVQYNQNQIGAVDSAENSWQFTAIIIGLFVVIPAIAIYAVVHTPPRERRIIGGLSLLSSLFD